MTKYNKAVLELFFAAVIWGASFTLVRWGLEDFSTSSLLFWRFVLAFFIGEIGFRLIKPQEFKKSWSDAKLSLWAGLFLGASLCLQSYGLNFTTATNSGFITSLYVILIPIISAVLFRSRVKWRHLLFGALAFLGMGFLLDLKSITIAQGEILTFGAAITAALQIISIGRVADRAQSAFRFNNYQTFWSCVILIPFLIYEINAKGLPLWPEQVHFKPVASIVALSLSVSIFAFFLQVRAQQILNTTVSSMLCLLEGPFAFFFGALFLGERLSLFQGFGAFLILLSCALSVYFDRPQYGNH